MRPTMPLRQSALPTSERGTGNESGTLRQTGGFSKEKNVEIKLEALVPDERSWVRKDGGVLVEKDSPPRPFLFPRIVLNCLVFQLDRMQFVVQKRDEKPTYYQQQ